MYCTCSIPHSSLEFDPNIYPVVIPCEPLEESAHDCGFFILEQAEKPRWCPSSLAKLVNITPISLWFMVDITIVFMG